MLNVGRYNFGNPNGKFIIRNEDTKFLRVLGAGIGPGAERNLLVIPGISESDIRHSLLKGELALKLRSRQISIVESDINLVQFNTDQKVFLEFHGITEGIEIKSAVDNAVDNIAALTAMDDTSLVNGTLVSVNSLHDFFRLDKSSSLTVTEITILNTLSGTGRWVRVCQPSLKWQSQSAWYISSSGNDEASGLTAGVPIKTQAEWVRRVGVAPVVAMTINVLSNLTENMIWTNTTPNVVTVRGALSNVLYSGTATAQVTWSSGSSRDGKITDTAIPTSWTASDLIGKLGILTSGSFTGYRFWVWKDLTAKTCRYTRLTNDTGVVNHVNTGDAFTIYDPIKLTGTHNVNGSFAFEYLEFGTDAGTASQHSVNSGAATFTSCKMHGMNLRGVTFATMHTCWFAKGLNGGVYDNATVTTAGMHFADGCTIRHAAQLHPYSTTSAAKFVLEGLGHLRVAAGGTIGIFECVNGIEMGALTSINATGARMWGVDVTGVGVTMSACARIVLGAGFPISIATPATQVSIAGVTKLYSELPYVDAASGSMIVVI